MRLKRERAPTSCFILEMLTMVVTWAWLESVLASLPSQWQQSNCLSQHSCLQIRVHRQLEQEAEMGTESRSYHVECKYLSHQDEHLCPVSHLFNIMFLRSKQTLGATEIVSHQVEIVFAESEGQSVIQLVSEGIQGYVGRYDRQCKTGQGAQAVVPG